MKKYTIEEIAYKNQQAGGHYFDDDTLAGFNQRLSDFRVLVYKCRVFVYAQSRGWTFMNRTITPWSVAEILETGRTKSVDIEDLIKHGTETTREDIVRELKRLVDRDLHKNDPPMYEFGHMSEPSNRYVMR